MIVECHHHDGSVGMLVLLHLSPSRRRRKSALGLMSQWLPCPDEAIRPVRPIGEGHSDRVMECSTQREDYGTRWLIRRKVSVASLAMLHSARCKNEFHSINGSQSVPNKLGDPARPDSVHEPISSSLSPTLTPPVTTVVAVPTNRPDVLGVLPAKTSVRQVMYLEAVRRLAAVPATSGGFSDSNLTNGLPLRTAEVVLVLPATVTSSVGFETVL